MKVHESIEIAAPPRDVWPQIADPQRMADWHVKLEEVRRADAGQVYVGERFRATYVMSVKKRNRQECETEVVRCEPWTTLVLRHHVRQKQLERHVDETFQLWPIEGGAGTRVEHAVDFSGAGLPLWARALMWCITRTGQPSGPGILEPLKQVCESIAAKPSHLAPGRT
jgi:uncharacterized protein YndB with AHSA1/START domain